VTDYCNRVSCSIFCKGQEECWIDKKILTEQQSEAELCKELVEMEHLGMVTVELPKEQMDEFKKEYAFQKANEEYSFQRIALPKCTDGWSH
jgi:hypothetical protein